MALVGPNSFYPLGSISKKQTSVSHSTDEAEIVAMNLAVRTEGLPALELWEFIFGRKFTLDLFEDNQATSRIVTTGRAPRLKHIHGTHAVSIAWLHERHINADLILKDCSTTFTSADIFTKHFANRDKWLHT